MAWRGFAIGVLISAPMGPVGMLCIQRTLDKGRKAGFYTGIGAAVSDLLYCLITGFFLSLIEDFLQENQNIIQLIGSLVLIAFSIYLFRKSPSASLRRPMSQNVSAKKNILGGFLFTFSNPLIIFLIIGLFARFNFSAPEINGGYYAVGYVFLVAGALAWWYGVTYLIDKVRSRFNMRAMKGLNVIIGLVILAFACVGIVTSIIGLVSAPAKAASVGNPPYKVCQIRPLAEVPSSLSKYKGAWRLKNTSNEPNEYNLLDLSAFDDEESDYDTDSITQFQLDFKLASNIDISKKKIKYKDSSGVARKVDSPSWYLLITDSEDNEIDIKVHFEEYWPTPVSSQPAMMITASANGEAVDVRPLVDGVSMRGLNNFRVVFDAGEGVILNVGNHSLGEDIILQGTAGILENAESVKIITDVGSDFSLLRPELRLATSPSARKCDLNNREIDSRVASTNNPLEGRWKVFDYSLEDKNLKSGGEYVVDIIRRPDGVYEIVYNSGATVNGSKWSRGDVKGSLRPTGHDGVYNLQWRDAEGAAIPYPATAQQESIDLITIHFPALNSQMRLKRIGEIKN